MPLLLILGAVIGGLALAATQKGPSGNPQPGPHPSPTPLPSVTVMRHGHRYYFVFRTDHPINDPAWWHLAQAFTPQPPTMIGDAAHFVLASILASLGFADLVIAQDQIAGMGIDPTVWRGSATWTGPEGEPVEHIVPFVHPTPAAVIWLQISDLGVPLPTPVHPLSVQGALPMFAPSLISCVAPPFDPRLSVQGPPPVHHGGRHHGGHWYPRGVPAWGLLESSWAPCPPGWTTAPDGSCVYVGG